MDKMDHMKLQLGIKEQCEDTKNQFQEIYNWQKEMKEKEKARLKGGQSETTIPEVRSKAKGNDSNNNNSKLEQNLASKVKVEEKTCKQDEKTPIKVANTTTEKKSQDLSNQNEADLFKEKGNNLVKLGKHEEAIYFYTAAIKHFDKEPIYFSNRALCYLKLEKYDEAIKDCDEAIKLNKTNVKAHYRRMQAYEFLGQNVEALKSCDTVLKLDPKNLEAKKSQERIKNRIKKSEIVEKKPVFTVPNSNMEEIEMFFKPPHLRSNKPTKKIKIKEVIDGKPHKVDISDEVLDKLFTNNNISGYEEIKKVQKLQSKASIDDINVENNSNNDINDNKLELDQHNKSNSPEPEKEDEPIKPRKIKKSISNEIIQTESKDNLKSIQDINLPTNSAQFYLTWKELNNSQRFELLKKLPINRLNKLLGAGLEPDTLTEIFIILNEYYLKDNMEIIDILKELTKHDEFSILSMFLSGDDRDLMYKFVKYMKSKNNDMKDIELIEDLYYLKGN